MTNWSDEELLEHRHQWKVSWGELWPGRTVDGQEITCHLLSELTIHDAINYQRAVNHDAWKKRGVEPVQMADIEYLWDFIAVHWAEIKTPEAV